MSGYNLKKRNIYCIILSEDLFTCTNSVDPDEMHHYAAFHLGLHCLQKYPFSPKFPEVKSTPYVHRDFWVISCFFLKSTFVKKIFQEYHQWRIHIRKELQPKYASPVRNIKMVGQGITP